MDSAKKYFSTNLILILFFMIMLSLSGIVNKTKLTLPQLKVSKEEYSINFNTSIIFFDIGYHRFVSSLLWIETLLNSDLSRDFDRNLNSWMYFRFKTIAKLEPKFLENYQYGGQYLSIVKDDLIGAEDIFKAGLEIYPNDYFLNYNLGFLYFNEIKNYQKALPYFINVKNDPKAPAFIDLLVATIMQKNNIPLKEIIKFVEQERALNTKEFLDEIYRDKLIKLRNE